MPKYNVPLSGPIKYDVTVNAENEEDAKNIVCRNFLGPCTIELEDYNIKYNGEIASLYSDKQIEVLKKFRFNYEFNALNYDEADEDFVYKYADDPDGMIRSLRDSLVEVKDTKDCKEYTVRIDSFIDYSVIVEAENKAEANYIAEQTQHDGPCTIKFKNSNTLVEESYYGMIDTVFTVNETELVKEE